MSRALILGTVKARRLAVLSPIGFVNGEPVFPHIGSDNDSGAGDGSADDGDGDGDDDEGGSDKDGSDDGKEKSGVDNALIRKLRREHRAMSRKLQAFEKAEQEKGLASKSEAERATTERDAAVTRAETAEGALRETQTQLAIIMESSNKGYVWADLEDVLNDRTLQKAIEFDDNGDIEGVADALKDLAKRKPHFLKKPKDDSGESKARNVKASSGSGAATGANFNGGSQNNDRGSDRDRLLRKYPSLGNMVETTGSQ